METAFRTRLMATGRSGRVRTVDMRRPPAVCLTMQSCHRQLQPSITMPRSMGSTCGTFGIRCEPPFSGCCSATAARWYLHARSLQHASRSGQHRSRIIYLVAGDIRRLQHHSLRQLHPVRGGGPEESTANAGGGNTGGFCRCPSVGQRPVHAASPGG